jgi:transposase-like protein
MKKRSPFRYFKTSPEIIRLTVMLYIRFPLSLPNVEDLLHEQGIEISHETVRYWWNRFGPMFAAEIRGRKVEAMRACRRWRWHLDEVTEPRTRLLFRRRERAMLRFRCMRTLQNFASVHASVHNHFPT